MSKGVIDRSLDYEETILVEFKTGPTFRVPAFMSVREVAAYLLTPDLEDEELENLFQEILAAGERKMKNGEEPDFDIFLNSEKVSVDSPLPDVQKAEIQIK